ncbi:MAG TPA: hypothetical protein VFP96_07975 [Candidatus Acidoferrum sp.]|nr:hypothetical protein [Candidatus Acidoferrum sp.]
MKSKPRDKKDPGGPISWVFLQPRDKEVTYEALFATACSTGL